MKILTESRHGIVIELNDSEFIEFRSLINAVEGKTFDSSWNIEYTRNPSFIPDKIDMTSVFSVIRAFYEQKFRLNEIEHGLQILRDALENK